MRLWKATQIYLNSKSYCNLSASSQKFYESNLRRINKTLIGGKPFANKSINSMTIETCVEAYDTWEQESSTSTANHLARVFSVVANHMIMLEKINRNPMKFVKKRQSKPRSVVWTQDQVITFLDAAYSKFEWRNIGLIVQMCYEWGQRPVDIRNLTFDQIDWLKRKVDITQTKRGSEVELPIPSELYPMLKQQHEDWGFQEYVVPLHRPQDNAYRPFTVSNMTSYLKEVKAHCGLPDELQVGDLRKTAITELIESGVDSLQIQSVTGHKNVRSLDPYNKFSFDTAKAALDRRKSYVL